MLAKKPFQIKIALLGNANTGKSTLLNALLRDQYTDTETTSSSARIRSNKTAGAGVNYFRVVSSQQSNPSYPALEPQSASSIRDEISEDIAQLQSNNNHCNNSDIRISNNTTPPVREKWFTVEIEEDLCDMRKDTQLVFVDIPGIANTDEAGDTTTKNNSNHSNNSSNKYLDYVNDKWNSFDALVLVLDGTQDISCHLFLLHLVKTNLNEKKDVPVIVLCNKIDDPEDEEQIEVVQGVRATVEDVFQVDDATSSSSLQFLPISGLYAYIHRCASHMGLQTFRNIFDHEFVDKLGKAQLGKRKWSTLSAEEKVAEVYDKVSSKQEVLQESNFEAFLSALNRFVGGEDGQRSLIEKQFQVTLWALQDPDLDLLASSSSGSTISELFHNVFQEAQILYGNEAQKNLPQYLLNAEFWKIYKSYEEKCLDEFRKRGPLVANILAGPVGELLSFHKLCEEFDPDESTNVYIAIRV